MPEYEFTTEIFAYASKLHVYTCIYVCMYMKYIAFIHNRAVRHGAAGAATFRAFTGEARGKKVHAHAQWSWRPGTFAGLPGVAIATYSYRARGLWQQF